jgi:hypothetical protein
VVRRRALHGRGLPLLLGGRGQRSRPVALGAAQDPDGGRPAAKGRVSGRFHRPLFLGHAERGIPAGAGRNHTAFHLPSGLSPEALSPEMPEGGQARGDGGRVRTAELGGPATARTTSTATTTLPPSVLDASHIQAARAVRLHRNPLLPRRRRTGCNFLSDQIVFDRRRQAHPGQDGGRIPICRRATSGSTITRS